MTHTITDSRCEQFGSSGQNERAISQDGQVTILDLQKHMAYLIWKFQLSEPSNFKSPSPIMSGIFQPHFSQKGLAREYNFHGLEYFLGPS